LKETADFGSPCHNRKGNGAGPVMMRPANFPGEMELSPDKAPIKTLRRFLFLFVLLTAGSYGFEAAADCFRGSQNVEGNWLVYEMQNDCDYRIKFSIDYCFPQDYSIETSPPDCEVRTLILESHTSMTFRNYGLPLNPRNFR
jgi:hypothetical protein